MGNLAWQTYPREVGFCAFLLINQRSHRFCVFSFKPAGRDFPAREDLTQKNSSNVIHPAPSSQAPGEVLSSYERPEGNRVVQGSLVFASKGAQRGTLPCESLLCPKRYVWKEVL